MSVADAATVTSPNSLMPIESLDFSMILMKLMALEEGQGWTEHHARRVEVEYRRYLALTLLHGLKSVVPSQEVDVFWHYHILDTQAYVEDCDRALGGFLHHFPYFGMRGEEDFAALSGAYDETLELYSAEFGPAPEDLWPREGMSRCPKCGRR